MPCCLGMKNKNERKNVPNKHQSKKCFRIYEQQQRYEMFEALLKAENLVSFETRMGTGGGG